MLSMYSVSFAFCSWLSINRTRNAVECSVIFILVKILDAVNATIWKVCSKPLISMNIICDNFSFSNIFMFLISPLDNVANSLFYKTAGYTFYNADYYGIPFISYIQNYLFSHQIQRNMLIYLRYLNKMSLIFKEKHLTKQGGYTKCYRQITVLKPVCIL